jgi:hypothetical protein
LLWKSAKLQKGETQLQSHGLAITISCDPRATRVFVIHGSATLHLSGTKIPGPKGIITVKGSFELSDLCDKEFHKIAQNFGMMASYGELMLAVRLMFTV